MLLNMLYALVNMHNNFTVFDTLLLCIVTKNGIRLHSVIIVESNGNT